MTSPDDISDDERASRLHSALAVEELVRANSESNATMLNLIKSVTEETKARDRKVDALEKSSRQMRGLLLLGTLAITGLLALAVFNAINISSARSAAHKQAAIAEDVKRTNDLLLDCLSSAGKCGQFNAQQQKNFLDEVKKYELTVLYCVRLNPQPIDKTGDKFIACVNRLYPGGPQLNGR